MQEDKEKSIKAKLINSEETPKRTTIILEKEEREFIDSLIEEGKEPGIKPLISKILNVHTPTSLLQSDTQLHTVDGDYAMERSCKYSTAG